MNKYEKKSRILLVVYLYIILIFGNSINQFFEAQKKREVNSRKIDSLSLKFQFGKSF
jgi:hypothetical protein